MNEYTKKLEAEEQIMNKEKEVAQLQKKLHEITEKYNKKIMVCWRERERIIEREREREMEKGMDWKGACLRWH